MKDCVCDACGVCTWRDAAGSNQLAAPVTGSLRFHRIADELKALHDKKQRDYGRPADPFANVRASEDFGIRPWIGAMVRANDKMRRIQKAATVGNLANESLEDSLRDLAVYSIIALILLEDEQRKVSNKA